MRSATARLISLSSTTSTSGAWGSTCGRGPTGRFRNRHSRVSGQQGDDLPLQRGGPDRLGEHAVGRVRALRGRAGPDGGQEHERAPRASAARTSRTEAGPVETGQLLVHDHEIDVVAALVLEGAARALEITGGADDHPRRLELRGQDPADGLAAASHQGQPSGQRLGRRGRAGLRLPLEARREPERASAPGRGVHSDASAHHLGQPARDGEAEPGPPVAARGRAVAPG